VAGHVLPVAVKHRNLAGLFRAVHPPGWLSPRVEVARRVYLACLFQMVRAQHLPEIAPDWVLLRVLSLRVAGLACLGLVQMVRAKPLPEISLALPSRPVARDRVCLLGWVKPAPPAPSHRPQPWDSRQPLVMDRRLRVRPRQLAVECSWDFRF